MDDSNGTSIDAHELGNGHPFGEAVYLIAAVLDPMFELKWMVNVTPLPCFKSGEKPSSTSKDILETMIKDLVVLKAEAVGPGDEQVSEDEEVEAPEKVIRLYDSYRQRRASGNKSELSEDSTLVFWSKNKGQFSKLVPLFQRTLSVIASSAPVERVFSHGGIILRPHRARLGD
ncbi:uncharacterized protein [Amphiura filiformis]|uniref:uncharacterized protein n=1 Tax=Amphiura filiformis TaxID=82378 RepID=UPI003B21779D